MSKCQRLLLSPVWMALAWPMPVAAQTATASAKAGQMAGMMAGAAGSIAVLVLVLLGYLYMAGKTDRESMAFWVAGFAVLLAAPAIAAALS